MRKITCIMVFTVCLMFGTVPLRADSPFDKLGRGMSNSLMAWAEIPNAVGEGVKQENKFIGIVGGLGQGTGKALQRFGIGLYEVFTCAIPGKSNYEPILDPEFVFDSF